MNVLIITRHTLTEEQILEIEELGYTPLYTDLGQRNLNSSEELREYLHDLEELIRSNNAKALFGVFPTPVLAEMLSRMVARDDSIGYGIKVFHAWNISRTIEGERPSFQHRKWLQISELYCAK